MPLTDLVRHLNSRSAIDNPGQVAPFATEGGQVLGRFGAYWLESRFLPIVDTGRARFHGHAAHLRASLPGQSQELDSAALFQQVKDKEDCVYLDRLIRTLHALNYLTRRPRGNLLLKVHRRHVLAVQDNHGLAFEEILRPCGLVPDEITLELDISGIHQAHLTRAVDSYRRRGYGIAVSATTPVPDWALLERLRPDILRLSPVSAPAHDQAQLNALGIRSLWRVSDGQAPQTDLVQASLSAQPQAAERVLAA